MNFFKGFRKFFSEEHDSRNIALVLSGGGARGYAHIGAIEVLQERGYNITSVAGTSMGAFVGGVYAAGKLDELRQIVLGLKKKKMLKIMDISPGMDHLASGENLMELLNGLVGDMLIENLPVAFCCCASDVVSGEEKVFREGLLKTAIRASISIPCFFKPVTIGGHVYVDGSIHNTLPLDRVERREGDKVVAVNVSAPNDKPLQGSVDNVMNMAMRISKISIQNNTQMAIRLTPPDLLVSMPMDTFSIFDFDKGWDIVQYGRDIMNKKLDEFEA